MYENHSIEKEFLIQRLEQHNKKFLMHLLDRKMLDIFYDKCSDFVSEELKKYLKITSINTGISDEAFINQIEEVKIKLLSKAIRKLKPFFYTI